MSIVDLKFRKEVIEFISNETPILNYIDGEITDNSLGNPELPDIIGKFHGRKYSCKVNAIPSFLFPTSSFDISHLTSRGSLLSPDIDSYIVSYLGLSTQTKTQDMDYKNNTEKFKKENCDKAEFYLIRKQILLNKIKKELKKYTPKSIEEVEKEIRKLVEELNPKRAVFFDFQDGIVSKGKGRIKTAESGFKFVCSAERESKPISIVVSKDIIKQCAVKKWLVVDKYQHYVDENHENKILMQLYEQDTGRIIIEEKTVAEYLLWHLMLKNYNGEYLNLVEDMEDALDIECTGTRTQFISEIVSTYTYKDIFELAKKLEIGIRGRDFLFSGMDEEIYRKFRWKCELSGIYNMENKHGEYSMYEYDMKAYLDWRKNSNEALEIITKKD